MTYGWRWLPFPALSRGLCGLPRRGLLRGGLPRRGLLLSRLM